MGLILDFDSGQTELTEDEKEGLLITSIVTRNDLNEFEQANIEDASQFFLGRRYTIETMFADKFIKLVHKKMYEKVWSWAGSFRTTNKNLGIDKHQVQIELKKLIDDCLYWIENSTFTEDEIIIRFKHRLVSIHCFVNGNGRHSRFLADLLIDQVFNKPQFTWGANYNLKSSDPRKEYLHALKDADKGNYASLLKFARS